MRDVTRPPSWGAAVDLRRVSWSCAAVFAMSSSLATAQTGSPDALVRSLVTTAQENFWGRAVLSNGETVQPVDDAERTAPVIPFGDSARVVNGAMPVARALWCGVEWQPYYLMFMQAERRGSWSEKQIAFIGVLFGLTQGVVSRALIQRGPCSAETRDRVVEGIGAATNTLQAPAEDVR